MLYNVNNKIYANMLDENKIYLNNILLDSWLEFVNPFLTVMCFEEIKYFSQFNFYPSFSLVANSSNFNTCFSAFCKSEDLLLFLIALLKYGNAASSS